jgi:hypothetical protein
MTKQLEQSLGNAHQSGQYQLQVSDAEFSVQT